jgi:soluble lytic murein transglycosylase-like protein
MPRKLSPKESISERLAALRRRFERTSALRILGSRGAVALLLGTALSVGGISETLGNVQYLVRKDLDAVRVVRQSDDEQQVVASVGDRFAGNALFKLAQVLPDRFVSRELALFDGRWADTDRWLDPASAPEQVSRDPFYEEMRRINDSIRAEFFAEEIPYGELIHEKARKYDVDPALVAAVIEQESRFKARAQSHRGAKGLMQLMPRTGRWMGASNLYDPEQNIDAGVKYIKYLHRKFNGDLKKTIAAYNAGEGNVARYRGIPPFRETRQYVKKVLKNYDKRTRQLEQYRKDQLGGGSIPEPDGTLALR